MTENIENLYQKHIFYNINLLRTSKIYTSVIIFMEDEQLHISEDIFQNEPVRSENTIKTEEEKIALNENEIIIDQLLPPIFLADSTCVFPDTGPIFTQEQQLKLSNTSYCSRKVC